MFFSIMTECFFGQNASKKQINGKVLIDFFLDLHRDIAKLRLDPYYKIFGIRFVDLGLK